MEEYIISRIEVRSKVLLVVYAKFMANGLFRRITSDKEVREFIQNNLDEAFSTAVQKNKDGYYILNIASVVNYGDFPWEDGFPRELLNRQLEIFNPLIQKFIADAATRTLEI